MTAEGPSDTENPEIEDDHSPDYWIKKFEGTPMSVVVPPYIRFLEGFNISLRAQSFLHMAERVAKAGHPQLTVIYDELEQSKAAKRLGLTYETYFASQLTINMVSEIEHFIGSAVSAALRMYPKKMSTQSFKLADIISADSTDELIDRAARSVLNEIMYEKPSDYVKHLESILSINMTELAEEWSVFVELKARRDLGVHNNWVVNEIYAHKLREAGIENAYAIGEGVAPDFTYLHEAGACCSDLIDKMVNLLGERFIPLRDQ